MSARVLPRLIFLAAKLGRQTPRIPHQLERFLPEPELIRLIASDGLEGAALQTGVSTEQLKNLANIGKCDTTTPEFFRLTVAQAIIDNTSVDDLPLNKRISLYGEVRDFSAASGSQLLELEDVSLQDIKKQKIPTWPTGFTPLDIVLGGGIYQALTVIMAPPGTGKTSTMITMAESIKRRYASTRILFFEQEFPRQLMEARMSPILDRGNPFDENDRLITGATSIEEIYRRAYDGPEDQVIFLDSPDSMTGGTNVDYRGELEHIYRQLIRIKERCKLVVVASQPRRADAVLSQASVAGSWAKAWYADIIVGIVQADSEYQKMKVLKNRFGVGGREILYKYNLEDLSWEDPLEGDDADW